MSIDKPHVANLRADMPKPPERCNSCNAPIDPHNGECRCS